ncbi:hypothetical protein Adu01nite_53840 [Paractinoplanes durhamensis]|uniref:Uncharacterized protein n=1 Tax=Paractinoplanes durhamensis TaxID=113563 RepID=A0ABQ3Z3B4_9ACTN|nr:hypothetical protein Adu01nite_53840 [Actinoplanes durhamensis]
MSTVPPSAATRGAISPGLLGVYGARDAPEETVGSSTAAEEVARRAGSLRRGSPTIGKSGAAITGNDTVGSPTGPSGSPI